MFHSRSRTWDRLIRKPDQRYLCPSVVDDPFSFVVEVVVDPKTLSVLPPPPNCGGKEGVFDSRDKRGVGGLGD